MRRKRSEEQLLTKLKNGDQAIAKDVYQEHAQPFIRWVSSRYPGFPEAEIIDIYQEAFTTFYFQVRDGKLGELKAQIQTYLFAIGKNLLHNAMRKRSKWEPLPDGGNPDPQALGLDLSMMENYQKNHQADVVRRLLDTIGDPCKTVLELSFFRRYAPEALADAMNYKNEATARVRKTRCLKRLSELAKKLNIGKEKLF